MALSPPCLANHESGHRCSGQAATSMATYPYRQPTTEASVKKYSDPSPQSVCTSHRPFANTSLGQRLIEFHPDRDRIKTHRGAAVSRHC